MKLWELAVQPCDFLPTKEGAEVLVLWSDDITAEGLNHCKPVQEIEGRSILESAGGYIAEP